MNYDLICVGVTSLDTILDTPFIPKKNSECFLGSYEQKHGGAAANVAAIAAFYGKLNVGLMSSVGEDKVGRDLLRRLRTYGVDIQGVQIIPNSLSTQIVTIVDNKSSRRYLVYLGALDKFSFKNSPRSYFGKSKIFYLAPASASIHERVVKIFKRRRTSLVLNPGTVYVEQELLEKLKLLLPSIEYLIVNEDEAHMYSGKKGIADAGKKLLEYGCKAVIITRENFDTEMFYRNSHLKVPGYKSSKKSTIGAGDAFSAGFLTGIVKNLSIETCLQMGNAFAAYEISQEESRPLRPKKRHFLKFLKEVAPNLESPLIK